MSNPSRQQLRALGCGRKNRAGLTRVLPAVAGAWMLAAAFPNLAQAGQVGTASWYGPGFHGKTTASGERFNQNQLTAAHRRLPLGTRVKVTNLNNGRKIEVRINDRGPYRGGRIIDLSKAAAQRLAMHSSGVARVRVETVP
ncbi:MAG: septal ring lytic transglycosylase RlpA family protein [Candidatus Competibacteraceae bacterium]|nr:septal ring lytic transglycosylase RlpA family protein [Candidatus Competibacteraceae bacterium]